MTSVIEQVGADVRWSDVRPLRTPFAAACLLVLAVPMVTAPQSHAHGVDDLLPAGASPADLRALETMMLGAEHAAEHAAARRADPADVDDPRAALSSEGAVVARAPGTPAEIGAWTQAPFKLPTYAINAALLPTGKVFFYGRPPRPGGGAPPSNVGEAALWSPWLGTGPEAFTNVPPPVVDPDGPGSQPPGPAPLFCSGQSLLPSGEVVIAGGTLAYPNTYGGQDDDEAFRGLQMLFTFDPFSETWVRQPDMAEGRWYPTQIMLPDGRTVIAGGLADDPPGGVFTHTVELFTPSPAIGGQGSVVRVPSADRAFDLYPRLLPLGEDVFLAGPRAPKVGILDTADFTWNNSLPDMSQDRLAGNAVQRPGGPKGSKTYTTLGGYERMIGQTFYPATATAETIAPTAKPKPAAWTPEAPLNVPRANANTVVLPDGSMVVVGGGSGFDEDSGGGYVTYADGRARQVELYDPESNGWRLGPAQQEDRAYHSTAVLLPDGRVFSAGDDRHPEELSGAPSQSDTAEIYSPPYLFRGARPVIESAPQRFDFGDRFGILSRSSGIDRAVLIAPSATTHGVDMHQRHVELAVKQTLPGEGVDVVSPPSAEVAPPGHYMLFLLNKAGVPSLASWVRIDPGAPDRALTDTKAPKVKITKKPKRKSGKRKAKFRFKASERGSSFECKVDGKKFRRCDTPFKVRVGSGSHKLKVRATDTSGNTGRSARTGWKVKGPKR